jgi:hypothetical protein
MALAISSTQMYVMVLTRLPLCVAEPPLAEHEYCAVFHHPGEGRQGPTDGLLPGPSVAIWHRRACTVTRTSPQSGVGTFATPQVVTPIRAAFQKYLNMAIANHLDAHIMGTSCSLIRVLFELTDCSLQVATSS